ncbi:hypothetical protein [Scleromatobacter humisilvae]|uniref:Uncharacterized protein n=1 Tax=Scleromatobacter humisilvae TaxID=2897159 RepID=A0A9X2C261_9BURK|nr:hypothetical protein [Scleromatobacter humisilvae]MCK9686464.1 hypothetical protein [Scleromatobacter humisilvae]
MRGWLLLAIAWALTMAAGIFQGCASVDAAEGPERVTTVASAMSPAPAPAPPPAPAAAPAPLPAPVRGLEPAGAQATAAIANPVEVKSSAAPHRHALAKAAHPPVMQKVVDLNPPAAGAPEGFVSAGDVVFWAEPETESVQSHVFLDCTPKGVAAAAIPASAATAAIPNVHFSHVIVAELHADKKDFDIPRPVQRAVILGNEVARLTWDITPVAHPHKKSDPDESRKIWVTVSPTTQVGNELVPDTTFEKDTYIDVKIQHPPPAPWWKALFDWYSANADTLDKAGAAAAAVVGFLGTAWASLKAMRRKRRMQEAKAPDDDSPLPSIQPPQ